MKPTFISALLTPLNDNDELHRDGFAIQLDQNQRAGIDGVLSLGTMGLMQLQSDATYRDVVTMTCQRWRGEIMIGAGDASFPRTRDRILFLNTQPKIHGIAILAPYILNFSQDELIDYFRACADVAKAPVFLYDLPQLTRSKLQLETVLELSKHPNIKGIKCSDEPAYTRALFDRVGDRFRIIIAQPDLIDVFLRFGIENQLDGMFAIAPEWTVAIGKAARSGDWNTAAEYQRKISPLRKLLIKHGVMATATVIMNARGSSGKCGPSPIRMLNESQREVILSEPCVKELIETARQ